MWPHGGSGSTQLERTPLAQPSVLGGRLRVRFNIYFTGFPGSRGNWGKVWRLGPPAWDRSCLHHFPGV